jgi:hypothetical protein
VTAYDCSKGRKGEHYCCPWRVQHSMDQPRPTNGIFVAITVIVSTFVSSDSEAI